MRIGIFGCVANPGHREVHGTHVSVARAIREAGGMTQRLATGIVTVKSPIRGGRLTRTAAVLNIRKSAQVVARRHLRPGDVVVVQFNGLRLLSNWQPESQ